jgi:hypothetical protein
MPSDRHFSPFTDDFRMPFYYASLSSLKIYYGVAGEALTPFLRGTALEVAGFKDMPGQGVVSVEFQNYTGHGGTMLETVNEVEFNILAYPASRKAQVPAVTLDDFVRGMEQTKTIGGFRVYVPADNQFAVKAGRDIFGEPKFLTDFRYQLPALNLPEQKTWEYTVLDPHYPLPKLPKPYKPQEKDKIYTVRADLSSFPASPDGNPSSIVLYSMFPDRPDGELTAKKLRLVKLPGRKGYDGGRLIGSLWNIFDVDRVYKLDRRGRDKVVIEFGQSPHPMRSDMEDLLRSAPPLFVQVYQSDPVAVENRAYYVDV